MGNYEYRDQPFVVELNPTYFEYQLPISVKAVIIWRGKIPLLKNERDEWELPGGKLEVGEPPSECLRREIEEELGWSTSVQDPFYAWVYEIRPDRHVFVLTYLARYDGTSEPVYSNEHKTLILVDPKDIRQLKMPEDYKIAIARAVGLAD